MKNFRQAFLVILLLCFVMGGCGAEKYVTQRRNLMLIGKSEMPNNEKYKEATRRKKNKIKLNKSRRKSLY